MYLNDVNVIILNRRRQHFHGCRTISVQFVHRQFMPWLCWTGPCLEPRARPSTAKQSSATVLRLSVAERSARHSVSHPLPATFCPVCFVRKLVRLVLAHQAQLREPTSLDLQRIQELAGLRSCLASSLLSTAGRSVPRFGSGYLFTVTAMLSSVVVTFIAVPTSRYTRPISSDRTNKPLSLNPMLSLCEVLVHSNLTMVHVLAAEGFTVVAALELVCLASFSASAVALIESSSAHLRWNHDLHASECPPSNEGVDRANAPLPTGCQTSSQPSASSNGIVEACIGWIWLRALRRHL